MSPVPRARSATIWVYLVTVLSGAAARAQTPAPAQPVLHLEQAVDTALKQSPTLLSAQANVGSAQGCLLYTSDAADE